MDPSYRFVVTGRVQGVGFRANTQTQALRLGLRGWVRNRADGAVEGLVSGSEAALQQFHEWLPVGSAGARLNSLTWEASAEEPPVGFQVRW
jgi:acylphosphatase